MRIELENIKHAAETLLKEYKAFGETLSPYNPMSHFAFAEQQPLFEAKCQALLNAYCRLNNSFFSAEDLQQYEQLYDLLIKLKKEIY